MFGYILAGIVLIVLLVVGLSVVASARRRATGREPNGSVSGWEQPSADQPTPGASSTATPEQARKAQRHTPSA